MNWGKLYIDKPVICYQCSWKLVKDFIPLYRPIRLLSLTVTRGLFNCIIKLELWSDDARKNEVSVGLVTELRVMGHDRTCARAIQEMQTDGTTACTNLPGAQKLMKLSWLNTLWLITWNVPWNSCCIILHSSCYADLISFHKTSPENF